MSSDELTMVLVTRKDLKLSKGKLAAQCGHATMAVSYTHLTLPTKA